MPTLHPGFMLAWLLAAGLLAGCGQKGALYLPKPEPQASVPQQTPQPQAAASGQNPPQKP
ncbi:MAG TPA: lipoprotein [Candidatus Competibacteraceae bacterium]|nr:lipoprotein [Candidatus Competibacteraceae bacterium]MCP5132304.1 lipoprotein [Gammaproteobacteria bacterium]HPF59805.1 lipoprotein [Candidatus Competibacteraceae bacterium]HRY18112.1 lipoprotein [Candidatus Competibacteraceae bacterium]